VESGDQIKRFQEFFELHHHAEILENIRKGNHYFAADFMEISKFDSELAEDLLADPNEVFRAAELSIEGFEVPKQVKHFRIRFKNLPQSQNLKIRNIRSEHLGMFLSVDGIVRRKTDVRPQVTNAKFECPSCGNVINILQLAEDDVQGFREPSRCGCGRNGKFKLLDKELIDVQAMDLEESPDELEGGDQPKRMHIFLREDLVAPLSDKRTNPGSKIRVNGVLKEIPITLKSGKQSTRYDLLLFANYVEPITEDVYEINISPEEEQKILKLVEDPRLKEKLIANMAPSIYGYENIKLALLLQALGGVTKTRSDGMRTRGDIHVLLIGDPGAGKSQLLKRMAQIAPKARYVSGKGVSGAGLTATVVKDEFLRGWSLEAGALPLCNNGFCMIDELDKMTKEDRSAMHEALEQQTISISKANIQATLKCATTVLAAANPKLGRFDPYDNIAKQIDLPPPLISRFDLIFPIRDLPETEKDRRTAHHMLALHQAPNSMENELDTNFIKKYICYARQRKLPVLTDSAMEEIEEYYISMRNSGSKEGGAQAVPITPRQLEALIRLSEASAKLRMSDKVMKKDARCAIDILNDCLNAIGIDPDTGKIDIDRISSGISASQRGKIHTVKEIIAELELATNQKVISVDDIIRAAADKKLSAEEVEEILKKLTISGDIFEPKRGFINRL
jgi:replicative DNA helicase Mcm